MKIRISEEAKLLRIPQMPLIFRDFLGCVFLPVAFRGNFAIIMNRDSYNTERGAINDAAENPGGLFLRE